MMESNSLFPFSALTCLALQVSGDASLAAGGFEVEYDGSHVGQPHHSRLTLPRQVVSFACKRQLEWLIIVMQMQHS